jgi:4-amino-4-deoxy-L-arabinose transferase-like glycosyltransferase
MPDPGKGWVTRQAPEIALALLASVIFLGCLGSVDLWGKREQRASAEALDTIDARHWLVAEIQGRPRLEKPPLPRWTIASLVLLTGRRDEWVMRLPSAMSALGMVALVYALGRRMAGRSAGLAAGLTLTSFAFFISELRQAGNDGPLAFFTTLALYAAWRRLHAGGTDEQSDRPCDQLGAKGWTILFYGALGLGFLTKGPVILPVVALALLPYLALARRLRSGVVALLDRWGLVLFVMLALSWPLPVLLRDPNAARVWYLEMAQKAGSAGITHHRPRELLAVSWPWMTAPWSVVATFAVILPVVTRGRNHRTSVWLVWSWTVANLVMISLWKVAKPNYYLPCLPGAALLSGIEWVRLTRLARVSEPVGLRARRFLQANWVLLFVVATVAPVVVGQLMPGYLGWSVAFSTLAAAGVAGSAWVWRRGGDAAAMAPLVGALAIGVVIGYGLVAPIENPIHSHRALASTLERVLPPDAHTVMFFHELDEGLWFYLRDRALRPVPGSQPRYNEGYDMLDDFLHNRLIYDPVERTNREKQILLDWLRQPVHGSRYVLIRTKLYDLFAPDLKGLATPVLRERDMKRNNLVLLRIEAPRRLATGSDLRQRR